MLPMYSLDQVTIGERFSVGDKAYYLARLKQQGVPVTEGWVLPTTVWQHYLSTINWPQPNFLDRWADLDPSDVPQCQAYCRALRTRFLEVAPPPELPPLLPAGPGAGWLVRASVSPLTTGKLDLSGMLPAWFCPPQTASLAADCQQFWAQALHMPMLRILQHQRVKLADLPLASLVQPLYPAEVSGTLVIQHQEWGIEAVLGLGLGLTRGEAVPAHGQGRIGSQESRWQPGYQEQVVQVATHGDLASASPHPGLRVWSRDTAVLTDVLSPQQLEQLLELAQQAQQGLNQQAIRLEWLLYTEAETQASRFLITQADPLTDDPIIPLEPATQSIPAVPALPAVSLVVQGLSASAGRVLAPAVTAKVPSDLPQPLPLGVVVVVSDLQPDRFFQLQGAVGIITEQGGATCHAAILSRELGIPAVVGAPQATQLIASDDLVWLDGGRGLVYVLEDSSQGYGSQRWRSQLSSFQLSSSQLPGFKAGPHVPTQIAAVAGPTRTQVMVNLSQPRHLPQLPIEQIAGVGLLRSEWLLLEVLEGRHPRDWIEAGQGAELQRCIVQQLLPIVKAFAPKPVRYRALDLRSHEWTTLIGSPPQELNPMLGLRGTLSYDVDPRLFEVELAALAAVQAAGYDNLQLILPFVRTVEEFLACRQRVFQAGLNQSQAFELWIMAEVPSVLFLLPAYVKAGVQGIAIGTNDLTQLLLAVDRDQPVLASAYDERHPVVHQAMAHLIQLAHQAGIGCSICGQAPVRHPDLIPELVNWGITSISVESAAFKTTLETVWQTEHALHRGHPPHRH